MLTGIFSHPMWYLFVVMQAGIPTVSVGPPGCGKTAVHQALAKALGRRFVPLIGSQCAPEDVSGLPVPDHVKFLCRMMPMAWVEALLTPGGFLFLDEWANTSPAVHASMLTVVQDKRAGDVELDVDTIMAAAMNPVEICPNGAPLSLPTQNRFFHAKWKNDKVKFLTGLVTCEWDAPEFPILPVDWKSYVPKWGGIVSSFLTRNEEMINVMPKDDTTPAFPTERSWRNTVMCLAAADAVGADMDSDTSNVRLMVEGNVGEVATSQFAHFKQTLDLVDPLDIVDGKTKFVHRDDRPDLTMTVLGAVATAVSNATTFTPDRWDAAAMFFGEIGASAHPEIALRYTRVLLDATKTFKHSPSAKVLKPLIALNNSLKVSG
jgi:hypothetical protein